MYSSMMILLIFMTIVNSGHSASNVCGHNLCPLFDLVYEVHKGNDPNLHYLLFTRNNPEEACRLRPTSEAVRECKFNPHRKTEVIIHGWFSEFKDNAPPFVLKDKILGVEDANVVVFDWTYYANTTYNNSLVMTFYSGFAVASWLRFLEKETGLDIETVHMIGHSLGANVAAYASRLVCRKLEHMTYLEPAALTFRELPEILYPSHKDACHTDAVHTNGGNITFLRPVADMDYFPNGGQTQPGCYYGATFIAGNGANMTVTTPFELNLCYHGIALQYYIASVDKSCKFLGLVCENYEDYMSGECASRKPPTCRMGFYSRKRPDLPFNTKCYMDTSAGPPYCLN